MAYLARCVWEYFFCEAGCQKLRDAFVGSQSRPGRCLQDAVGNGAGVSSTISMAMGLCCPSQIMLELFFFPCLSLSLSLESYACKYRDLTFKIRLKKKKKSPVFPFTDVMVLCHPNGKEAAGLAPVVHAHRCWHQLCSALGQQAPGLPVCGMNSKWRTTLSPNCPQAATWIICGTSEFLLHAGKLAPHQVTACVCSPGGCGERRHP